MRAQLQHRLYRDAQVGHVASDQISSLGQVAADPAATIGQRATASQSGGALA